MCGPVLDSSQLSKKICLRLQGKSRVRTEAHVCRVDVPLVLVFLCSAKLRKNEHLKEGKSAYGWCFGGMEKGLSFFPFL